MIGDLDRVPGGVLALGADLRIQEVNAELGRIVGHTAGELVGQPFESLLTASSAILFQTHVYPALRADGRVAEVFLTLRAADGDPIPVLLNAIRTNDAGGPAFELLVVRIHARARWEADLLASTRALEQEKQASDRLARDLEVAAADKLRVDSFRDTFVGIISHELRTPITTIFGMSEVLRRHHATMDAATMAGHLDDLAAESDRLRRLTEDLLVLSRAEGGKLELSSDPILIGRLVAPIVESVGRATPAHTFRTTIARAVPVVAGDPPYVEQVLRNLLSNAGKYSPPGSSVEVRITSEAGGAAVRVVDDGPGFGDTPPERLFEVFYRTEDAKRRSGGAGIGLFVCRELLTAMGGRIWAAPAPDGPGAEFGFWLPAAEDDLSHEAATEGGPA